MKILLAMNANVAKTINAPTATVEAEYGATVIEGSVVTLAHHAVAYRHCSAPCNRNDVATLSDDATILVSHLDLDTIGGVLALQGRKPEHAPDFWSLAEFIDLNGPHHLMLANFSQLAKDQIVAVWAWSSSNRSPRRDFNAIHDVTADVDAWYNFLSNMTEEDIAKGRAWQANATAAVESCLVFENKDFRVFSSRGTFCNAGYFSPAQNSIIPCCISYSRSGFGKGSITLSLAESTDPRNACQIMQSLYGPLAGGHKGIAGSPRGVVLTRTACLRMARFILGKSASRRAVVKLALKMRRG